MSFPGATRLPRLRRLLAAPALLMLAAAFLPVSAQQAAATFPGHNGRIVFASDRSHFFDLYTVLPNGHDVHRVTNDPFLQLGPVWSPNGSRIAYAQCCNNGNFDIYAINANGTGARRLTNNHGQDIDPSYSRKGKIAYASEHSGNYDIWVMNGDGSHKHRITHDKADELEPAWNPGGTKIAFQSTKTGHGDIYTMSPTGHDVKRITSNAGVDKEPTWSPSGKKICFSALREANSKLFVVPAHRGGKGRKLTHGAGDDQDPTWSPDGKRIAFVGIRGGARGGDIFTIGAQGGNLQKVVGSAKTYDVKPDWGKK